MNNLLRDFHGIQQEARTLLAKRQQVQAAQIDWEIGSIHDCRKTFGCRAADVVPMHVLQGYMGHAKSRRLPGTTSRPATLTPSVSGRRLRGAKLT